MDMCVYKAENAGKYIEFVNPRDTSQLCSRCGAVVKKDLSIRIHSCNNCGLVMDRDLNAALNIRYHEKALYDIYVIPISPINLSMFSLPIFDTLFP